MSDSEPIEEDEEEYGGLEGPNAMYTKLISSDGIEFIIRKEFAIQSPVIATLLNELPPVAENETSEIRFYTIQSHLLNEVCKYLTYKAVYNLNMPDAPDFEVPVEMKEDMLRVAIWLDL